MSKSLLQRLLLLIFLGASASSSSQETKGDLAAEFKKYDISGNGYLSGSEITACNCKDYDFDGDGVVMDTEFFKGRGGKNSPSTPVARAGSNVETSACNFEPPAPEYLQSAPFSVALAKRNLYNKYRWKANGTSMAPKRVGVTYLSFQALSPYKNTVTVHPARGAERLNSAAPPNVMIYPIRSKHLVCEEYSTGTTRYQVESDYDCFKDRDGEWVCGSSGTLPPKITQLD